MARIERIHLDPIGGIAGDMFVAAMADAFPEHVAGLMAEIAKLSPSPLGEGRGEGRVELLAHTDGILRGRRFHVDDPATDLHARSHHHGDGQVHDHLHVPHREIRANLLTAGLDPATLKHALALFELLAEAEGVVHGIGPDDVAFHEVGAWDSIVDFVAAAYFIAVLEPAHWTVGALPLGGGRVKTAHGVLPIPAPATAALLQGLAIVDDGVGGERVTPTGAAIARYVSSLGSGDAPRVATIAATGHGFGTMKLPGMPNLLRVIAFAESPAMPQPLDEEVATLQFEIDDQTAEDLAAALDRIRQAAGVLDACQVPVYGKKGRLATQVQVLARPEAVDAIADLCLSETTTLGVRISRAWRRTAARAAVQTAESARVKVASRPSGAMTAKAEMDDLARIPGGRDAREAARQRAEAEALRTTDPPHGSRKRD
jgi:hypothetical protein